MSGSNLSVAFVLSMALTACSATPPIAHRYPAVGRVVAYDPALDMLIDRDARIEKVAEGFTWAEGPAWVVSGNYLLLTDVPENTMYRWSERDGLSVFLKPSGFEGVDTGVLREPGANGLFAEPQGTVLLADSGNRNVARFDPRTKHKTPIASTFRGLRFNSPNDVVRRSDGVVYFTDPPYGLKEFNQSPAKELKFNGVFRIDIDGTVQLVDDGLSYPNGVALSPDGRTLYVSNTDATRPIWMAYALDDNGAVLSKRVFADASDLLGKNVPGLPDGMAVSADGHLFATAPGGVLVFDAGGKRLGRIETGDTIANCAFGDDGRTLYMASHSFMARTRVAVRGLGFDR